MRSPALALMGQVWWRYRWGLAACAAAWLMFAALGLLLPRGTWSPASPGDDPLRPVAWVVLVSFVPAFIHVLYAFSYLDEAQLEAREAGFPARNFILPVMTRTLVAWPMLQAAAVAAVTWVAWAGAVLRPVGLDVALVWPAVVTAALLAWLQALVWWPFPVRFLRCVVIALVLTVLAFVPVFGVALRLPPFVW